MKKRNIYDVYAWLTKVANSANTTDQKKSALNLIENFRRQFKIEYLSPFDNDLMMLEITTEYNVPGNR